MKKLLAVLSLSLLVLPSLACVNPQGGDGQGGGQGGMLQIILLVVPFILIFYWMIIRPEKKRKQEHQNMLADMKKGDEIITIAGMFGKIVEVRDERVIVEISDKVRVKMTKEAIATVVKNEDSTEE